MAQSCPKTQLTSVRCIIFLNIDHAQKRPVGRGGNFFIFLMAGLKLISDKLLWVAQVREKSTGLDCWRGQCFGLVLFTVKRVNKVVQHPHRMTQNQFSLVSENVSGIPEDK
jgi:hypothetical protein